MKPKYTHVQISRYNTLCVGQPWGEDQRLTSYVRVGGRGSEEVNFWGEGGTKSTGKVKVDEEANFKGHSAEKSTGEIRMDEKVNLKDQGVEKSTCKVKRRKMSMWSQR